MADVARLALQIDVNGAQRARQALRGLQDGSIRATQATQRLAASTTSINTAARNSAGAFRLQKGAMQQAGYQIGDFAVQVGAGQSALVAFSQQGAQLAGILGPGGAVLGAVIAIGGAIAGGLVRSFSAGEESTESLRERILDLRDSVDELTDAQIRQVKVEFFAENRERLAQINEFRERISGLRAELDAFNRAGADGTQVTAGLTDPDEARAEINRLTAEIDTLFQTGNQASEELQELINGTDDAGESAEKAAEKVREMVTAAEQQAATVGLSARATATYEAALAGANAEQIMAIDAAYRRVEAHEKEVQQQKALQEQYKITAANDPLLQRVGAQDRGEGIIQSIRERAETVRDGLDREFSIRQAHRDRVMALDDGLRTGVIDSIEERNRLEVESARQRNEQLAQLEQQKNKLFTESQESALGTIGTIFGNMAEVAKEGGKDQFNTWKAMAIAQAGVNTALAISNALATPPAPLGIALAGTIGALGVAQVAQIQQQEYQGSYLGGGYTGSGSRSGGVDGKGGFPAILHPNETVVDHELAGNSNNTSNMNQTLVFQLSGGSDSKKMQQEIMKAMPLIRDQAKAAVTQGIGQGGSLSRSVGRRP